MTRTQHIAEALAEILSILERRGFRPSLLLDTEDDVAFRLRTAAVSTGLNHRAVQGVECHFDPSGSFRKSVVVTKGAARY